MMEEVLRHFSEQLQYEPRLLNAARLASFQKWLVVGMGGSNHATELLKAWQPQYDIIVHRDYGLPPLPASLLRDRLIILSSYSGNTEEVLDSLALAQSQGLPTVAITTGGKLLEAASAASIPYIALPEVGIEPRAALGFMFVSLLSLIGTKEAQYEVKKFGGEFQPLDYESQGRALAEKLKDKMPLIYASTRNTALAANWKIKFNENTKIPAFSNVIPELNHNEISGFASQPARALFKKFHCLFLEDDEDEPRLRRRFEITAKIYRDCGLSVERLTLPGRSRLEKLFATVLLGDWTSCYLARLLGTPVDGVTAVQELKKLL